MRAWMIVVALVVIGVAGAWTGYWIGHAAGWTTDAEFPLTIGGGDRAIGLSIGASFLAVMAGAGWFVARPLLRVRRLLATGAPGRARSDACGGPGSSCIPGPGAAGASWASSSTCIPSAVETTRRGRWA